MQAALTASGRPLAAERFPAPTPAFPAGFRPAPVTRRASRGAGGDVAGIELDAVFRSPTRLSGASTSEANRSGLLDHGGGDVGVEIAVNGRPSRRAWRPAAMV